MIRFQINDLLLIQIHGFIGICAIALMGLGFCYYISRLIKVITSDARKRAADAYIHIADGYDMLARMCALSHISLLEKQNIEKRDQAWEVARSYNNELQHKYEDA